MPVSYRNSTGATKTQRRLDAIRLTIFLFSLVLASDACWCQPPADPATDPAIPDRSSAVAQVNDHVIGRDRVQEMVRKMLRKSEIAEDARPLIEAAALDELVSQQLVLIRLRRRKEAATDQETDLALSRLAAQLERQEKTLDDYCRALKLSRSSLRQRTVWQISWQRCLDRYLTDENLERYFEQHRQEFDGSRMRVAQILLKIGPAEPDSAGKAPGPAAGDS